MSHTHEQQGERNLKHKENERRVRSTVHDIRVTAATTVTYNTDENSVPDVDERETDAIRRQRRYRRAAKPTNARRKLCFDDSSASLTNWTALRSAAGKPRKYGPVQRKYENSVLLKPSTESRPQRRTTKIRTRYGSRATEHGWT